MVIEITLSCDSSSGKSHPPVPKDLWIGGGPAPRWTPAPQAARVSKSRRLVILITRFVPGFFQNNHNSKCGWETGFVVV